VEEVSVQKNISEKLPNIILVPNSFRVECKVVEKIIQIQVDAGHAEHLLDQKDHSHRDHQILNGGRQTMAKRETISVGGHFFPPRLADPRVQLS
jgi:hypothetical protein